MRDTTVIARNCITVNLLGVVMGQAPYTMEIGVRYERAIKGKHSLLLGAAAVMPGISSVFASYNMPKAYAFSGGKLTLGYRFYPSKLFPVLRGFFVGAEVTTLMSVSSWKRDVWWVEPGSHGNNRLYSPPVRAYAFMSRYGLALGYHLHKRKVDVEFGATAGYRYHYFWREFADGITIPFERKEGGLYNFYKRFPVGAALYLCIGRAF